MDNATALQAAVAAFQAGDAGLTERIARQQMLAGDDTESWLVLLAMALHSQARMEEAINAYGELTRRFPQSALHWGNLGTAYRAAGRSEDAEAAYCQAIVLAPADASHHLNMGLLLADRGDISGARIALLQASDLDPASAQARIYGAAACIQSGDNRGAERLLADHRQWARDLLLDDMLTLSNALLQTGHWQDAENTLFDAMDVTPEKDLVRTRLVALYERLNRIDDAQRIATMLPDPSTVADPGLAREIASTQASLAHRSNDLSAAKLKLDELSDATPAGESTQADASVLFELARICDKQGDTAEAMRSLQQAHAAQLRVAASLDSRYLDPDTDPLQPLAPFLSPEQYVRWPAASPRDGQPRMDPVFIVGFPRSGTTLLEQMLDATPGFRSMDERQFLQDAVEQMKPMGLAYPDQLGDLDDAQCDALRSSYWAGVANAIPLASGERVVDKNPLNMLRLPMMRRLFPDAPVILALRHPCDVILSCYMQQFRAPMFMAMCSSLERLARSYVTAMTFWIDQERLLQPKVFHLHYEKMLADFDGHAKMIGGFLGIDDTSAMHDFHGHARRKGFIGTPSYTQVIEPLNSSAVGRWRRYESHFRSALPILRPIMEHWGYAD